MIKYVALYRTPDDAASFDEHYFGTHVPLANATPGLVRTDFARALWEDPVRYRKQTRDVPLQRIGEPDEIAGAAVFLASRAGSFVTGHSLVVDGGATTGVVMQKEE